MEAGMRPFTAPATDRLPLTFPAEEEEDGGALEKFIVQELENEPFDLELNAASFSYMKKDELHELLDKILETVSPEKMESIYVAENKSEQILNFLQILRFRPAMDGDGYDFKRLKRMIDEADVTFFVSLMAWLLANMPTLQTRAYLSKFLTKLEIPVELTGDEAVCDIYDKYEAEIEKFKAVHKLRESVSKKKSLSDLQRDAILIQQDHECLRRKIDMSKAKVPGSEKAEEMLELIHEIRFEKQKQTTLIEQEVGEMRRENDITERMNQLRTTLKDLRRSQGSLTPMTLIEREEQELAIGREIVRITLPKSIGKIRRKIKGIRSVMDNPPRHLNDLEETKRKTLALDGECKRLEKVIDSLNAREISKEILAAKQQSSIVRSRLNSVRDRMNSMTSTLEATNAKLTQTSLVALSKKEWVQDDLSYIKNLRSKAKVTREKKKELASLRTQLANLQATLQNLDLERSKKAKNVDPDWDHFISTNRIEIQGDSGSSRILPARSTSRVKMDQHQIAKRSYNEQKQQALTQYSENVIKFKKELEDRKCVLVPLLQLVNESRKQKLLLDADYRQSKFKYDQAQIGSETEVLESTLGTLQKTIYDKELTIYKLQMDTKFNKLELERAKEENNCSRGRQRSFKERLLGKIVEQERVRRDLLQEEGDLVDNGQKTQEQLQMFSNLVRLLECKKATFSTDYSADEEEFPEEHED